MTALRDAATVGRRAGDLEAVGADLGGTTDRTALCGLWFSGGRLVQVGWKVAKATPPRRAVSRAELDEEQLLAALAREGCPTGVDAPSGAPRGERRLRECESVCTAGLGLDPQPVAELKELSGRGARIWHHAGAALDPSVALGRDAPRLFEVYPRAWVGKVPYKDSSRKGDASKQRRELAAQLASDLKADEGLAADIADVCEKNPDDLFDALVCAAVAHWAHSRQGPIRWPETKEEHAAAAAEGWFLQPDEPEHQLGKQSQHGRSAR